MLLCRGLPCLHLADAVHNRVGPVAILRLTRNPVLGEEDLTAILHGQLCLEYLWDDDTETRLRTGDGFPRCGLCPWRDVVDGPDAPPMLRCGLTTRRRQIRFLLGHAVST